MKFTRPQKRALEFFDLKARDPARLLLTRGPAPRTRNWLIERRMISFDPVGQFDFRKYRLTSLGRQALASLPIQRSQKKRTD
jgi:hypothetical protein